MDGRAEHRPYCCPVCGGRGLVPQGFYTAVGVEYFTASGTAPETCKSCWGAGVLWVHMGQDAPLTS